VVEEALGCSAYTEREDGGGCVGEPGWDFSNDEGIAGSVELESTVATVVGNKREGVPRTRKQSVSALLLSSLGGTRGALLLGGATYPITLSPFFNCETPSPTSYTSPATSAPKILGHVCRKIPMQIRTRSVI
jgi:hypothetical protein